MNERIEQLMKQADYPAPEMAGRAQRLIELLVKDFYDICNQAWAFNEREKSKEGVGQAEQLVFAGAMAQCQKMKENIEQQFGVKE
jgi:hypothetical protein